MKSKQEAQADFGDLRETFRSIHTTALRIFYNEQKTFRYRFGKGTEAAVINDYIRDEARKALAEDGRIQIIEKRRSFLICMAGYAIKLKKFDSHLRTRSIPTHAARSFLNQQPQLEGMPGDPMNLFLGYQRNDVEITTSPIFLVCPDGKEIEWDWQLLESEAASVEEPVQPAPSEPQPVLTPVSRVKPKVVETDILAKDKGSNDKKD